MIVHRQTLYIFLHQRCNFKSHLFHSTEKPFTTRLEGRCGYARALSFFLPHGQVNTPVYMPVGTKGVVKGITNQQL